MRLILKINASLLHGLCMLFLFSGCSSSLISNSKVQALTKDYCKPNVVYSQNLFKQSIGVQDSLLLSGCFSYHDCLLIKNIGLSIPVLECLKAQGDKEKIEAKQKIILKYLLFAAEVDAVAAELDCNGERIDQLAGYVDNLNSKKQIRLTISSILAGAVTSVTAATVKNDNLNNALSIAGGMATGVLGFMTLNPKGKKVSMEIDRNMLGSIWYRNNDAQFYPDSVWSVLSDKKFSNSNSLSMIETIRLRWFKYGLEGEQGSPLEMLYFKQGGLYTAEDLHRAANMHNELQATVRAIQQDLRSLMQGVNAL